MILFNMSLQEVPYHPFGEGVGIIIIMNDLIWEKTSAKSRGTGIFLFYRWRSWCSEMGYDSILDPLVRDGNKGAYIASFLLLVMPHLATWKVVDQATSPHCCSSTPRKQGVKNQSNNTAKANGDNWSFPILVSEQRFVLPKTFCPRFYPGLVAFLVQTVVPLRVLSFSTCPQGSLCSVSPDRREPCCVDFLGLP